MNILIFAPHNDDEVLGVGGTIAKYADHGHHITVCEVTSGKDDVMVNLIKQEALKAHKLLGVKNTIFLDLPVVALREVSTIELNAAMNRIVKEIKPEIAFIPHVGDMHVDHQDVANAAMVALRPIENPQLTAIYAYETLSETEWNIPNVSNAFIPNVWNDITEFIDVKLNAMRCYETQIKEFPHPRSLEAMKALGKLRGSTVGLPFAESFMSIRNIME